MDKKPVTRVLSQVEAKHLFDRFEEVHCFKTNSENEVLEQCPGWDWALEHVSELNERQPGGCRYRNTHKLCSNLQLAAEGHYVIEIRPKNEEDVKREKEYERSLLEKELRGLKEKRGEIEEKILAFENKLRSL